MTINIDKKTLQRQFGKAALSYDEHAQMQHEIAELLAAKLPVLSEKNIVAADLGCGTGVGIGLLSKHYPDASLIGIDIASEMLEVSKESYPFAQFLQQDIEKLSLATSSVDLLFSSSAMQWCDAKHALSECYRVLKPGGYLLFSTFLQGTLSGWRELWMNQQQIDKHQFLTEAAILQELEDVGFSYVSHNADSIVRQFSSFKQAVDSIRALGAGNAVKSKQAGLMGKQKYLRLKSQVERKLHSLGGIELNYETAYFVTQKGGNII